MIRTLRRTVLQILPKSIIAKIRKFQFHLKRFFLRSKVFSKMVGLNYFGLDNLDQKMEKFLNYENGYFVELGANDGIKQSNTLHLEIYHNWHGVLIEPEIRNYQKLIKNRSRKNEFFNFGCVGFNYKESKLKLIYSDLMTTPILSNSDVGDQFEHASKGKGHFEGENYLFEVSAKTLQEILVTAGAPKLIDFMSLDVEGGEMEVLEGIDHNSFRFRYLLIESRSPELLTNKLKANGYSLVTKLSSHDYLFEGLSNV
jgi:FkbM family methyltransferase